MSDQLACLCPPLPLTLLLDERDLVNLKFFWGNEDCASLYNKVTTTDHFWVSLFTCWRKPKKVFNSFIPEWFETLERNQCEFPSCSKATTCLVLSFRKKAQNGHLHISCLVHVHDHLHMFTCRQLHYAHILFNPLQKVSNAGMILPIAMKNPPTTVMCFHLIPLGLLSQFKCLKIGSILTSPHSKLGEFSEILVNWLFTHTIHQIGYNFRWEKLNFHTISLTLGSMVYPPMSNVSQCRSGRFHHLYVCDNRTLISRNTPTEPFFLPKAKSS
jgi:hypothetical protein